MNKPGRDAKDYYRGWMKMSNSSDTDTDNSIVNIIEAVEEFKRRSADDAAVTFLFLSNLWDNHRYKFKYPDVPFDDWLLQYQRNYTAVVAEILVRLRPNKDTLVLQTQHLIRKNHPAATTINPMNAVVKKIASFFSVPVFDEDSIMKKYTGNYSTDYLQDDIHQNIGYSALLAEHIVAEDWKIVNYCDKGNYITR